MTSITQNDTLPAEAETAAENQRAAASIYPPAAAAFAKNIELERLTGLLHNGMHIMGKLKHFTREELEELAGWIHKRLSL